MTKMHNRQPRVLVYSIVCYQLFRRNSDAIEEESRMLPPRRRPAKSSSKMSPSPRARVLRWCGLKIALHGASSTRRAESRSCVASVMCSRATRRRSSAGIYHVLQRVDARNSWACASASPAPLVAAVAAVTVAVAAALAVLTALEEGEDVAHSVSEVVSDAVSGIRRTDHRGANLPRKIAQGGSGRSELCELLAQTSGVALH